MIVPEPVSPSTIADLVKAAIDRSLAGLLLVPAAALVALASVAIKLTSRGPVLYRQTRVGKGGRPFTLYKLRTMEADSEIDGPRWSTPGDRRVTRVGRFLRRTHLDELPQLWNVLTGDMSLVGPRPERPEFVPTLASAIPRYDERLRVRPGVTGLAQVQLPADIDLDSVRRKLAYDLYYVESGGLWLDLRLLLATGFKVMGVCPAILARLFRLPSRAAVESLYDGTADAPPAEPAVAVFAPPRRIPFAEAETA